MKKVLITGGQGDIAKAICEVLLLKGGFDVYCPSKDEMDVTNKEKVTEVVCRYKPDILINNAGYIQPTIISEFDIDSERKTLDVNLFGVFNCTGSVLSVNKEALIINIGSSAGVRPRGGWASYCSAKAGIIMATKCWADENINAICISPGRTKTKMRKQLFAEEPSDTLLKPLDFAKVVLNAINGDYQFGQNIEVNVDNVEGLING